MASLRIRTLRDGSATFSVLFRDGPRQTSETFDTQVAAEVFKRDVERHGPRTARAILDNRRGQTAPARTVTEQLTAHIDALASITIGTRRRYQHIRDTIAAHRLGDLPLDVVARGDVAAWIRDLADSGLSGKTISVRRQLLSAALVRAVDDELMVRNPAHGVRVPRTERLEPTFLSPTEFADLLAAVPDRWCPLVITLFGTGMRFGEATALKVSDVHLTDTPATITVSRGWVFTGGPERITGAPKTERGRRTVALPAQVTEALTPLVAGRPPGEWLFAGEDGEPVHRAQIATPWRRWVQTSGIGKTPRIHDARHTHASWLIAAGVPLTTIQHRLGHASIKVTSDVYGHLAPEAQVQAARATHLSMAGLPQIGRP